MVYFWRTPAFIDVGIIGVICCCTIIAIPIGVQCFKFASFVFWPFGRDVVFSNGVGNFLLNVIWILMFGWELPSSDTSITKCVDIDKDAGIIALWHDESHLNRYAYENGNYMLLSPAYFYPEGWNEPFSPRILVREKTKYINVDKIKNHKVDLKHKLKHWLRHLTGKMIRF